MSRDSTVLMLASFDFRDAKEADSHKIGSLAVLSHDFTIVR